MFMLMFYCRKLIIFRIIMQGWNFNFIGKLKNWKISCIKKIKNRIFCIWNCRNWGWIIKIIGLRLLNSHTNKIMHEMLTIKKNVVKLRTFRSVVATLLKLSRRALRSIKVSILNRRIFSKKIHLIILKIRRKN